MHKIITHLEIKKKEFDLGQKLEEFVVPLNSFNALWAFFQEGVCSSPQDRDQQQTKHFTWRERLCDIFKWTIQPIYYYYYYYL